MKLLIGCALFIYGVYVFCGLKEAAGITLFGLFYFGISFLNGDLKINKGKLCCDDTDAETKQLKGLE